MAKLSTKACPECGNVKTFTVTEEQLKEYNQPNRLSIQHIFPKLSIGDRERFITGICPTCWDNLVRRY